MQLAIGCTILVLTLRLGAEGKPTFGMIADVLNALDDRPHYPTPYHHDQYGPVHRGGPLIQEDYVHGYDYDYGVVAPKPYPYYPPQAPPPAYGYYGQRVNGYYQEPHQNPHAGTGYIKSYERSGYKQRGY